MTTITAVIGREASADTGITFGQGLNPIYVEQLKDRMEKSGVVLFREHDFSISTHKGAYVLYTPLLVLYQGNDWGQLEAAIAKHLEDHPEVGADGGYTMLLARMPQIKEALDSQLAEEKE